MRLGRSLKGGIVYVVIFTLMLDILLLVQPLYMLQVYDRILVSASFDTLVFVSIFAALALVLLGFIDSIRTMVCSRLGAKLEAEAGSSALVAAMRGVRASLGDVQPLRDLATIRGFVSGRALLAFIDLPFVPVFTGLLYIIHPSLFWLTLGGAILLTLLALANQYATRHASTEAGEHSIAAMLAAQSFVRSTESVTALGMVDNVIEAWGHEEAISVRAQDRLTWINASFTGLSRALRIGLQVAIYGYGAYLALAGEITAGMIFASSLIAGRSLQPIDQVIAGWKGFVDTRRAWIRLSSALKKVQGQAKVTELPDPIGRLSLENVVVVPPYVPSAAEPLLKRISAEVEPGECIAVLGPSGAGKSTLMRAIVGAVPLRQGAVRVDGADIRNWNPKVLGRHFGYLAQDIELLPGTIAQNIARFDPAAEDVAIIAAAQKAEVHDLIQKLPQGYDTVIGPAGLQLSGGQRQRVGLARAFFGTPHILVLDEPNANLDAEGDRALRKALEVAREDRVTVLLVTQRRLTAERVDKIMILRDGALEDYGPRQEVLARQAKKAKITQETAKAAQSVARPDVTLPSKTSGRFPMVLNGGHGSSETY